MTRLERKKTQVAANQRQTIRGLSSLLSGKKLTLEFLKHSFSTSRNPVDRVRRRASPEERPPAGAYVLRKDRPMNMELSRRQFMAGAGAGLAGTTLGALGFGDVESAYAASIRPWKLLGTTETRNTCTYCSVACGIIMYSKGNLSKGEKADIIHIEGDPDHPTNRGTLCPKGAGLLDIVHAKTRTL